MIPFVQWVVALEVVGAAFLPLTLWLFRSLPDRGYIFAKVLGLVLMTYLTWLIGSAAPVAGSAALPLLVVIVCALGCWWVLGRETVVALRSMTKIIAIEEGLFLGALLIWSVLRAQVFHPGIGHTEQYMDMSLLGASIHSASYPPYDPWMSGHTINYYYMGYLLFGLLIKMAVVEPTVGYNLSLSFLFAFTVAGSFSLGLALTRRFTWALLAPLFVALAGNWHAILVQLPAGHSPGTTYYWFWDSTRVIGSNTTITEFPFFSFMLGDLHPHVMALPIVLLALAFACQTVMNPSTLRLQASWSSLIPWLVVGVTIGMLFTLNSWDFPTYLLVVAAAIAVHGYVTDTTPRWWQTPAILIVGLGTASFVLYTPFFLHFQSLTHGAGWVGDPSNLGEFLQVMGMLLIPAMLLVGSLALLFQPTEGTSALAPEGSGESRRTAEAGAGTVGKSLEVAMYATACGVAIVGAHFHVWVMLVALTLGAGACGVLHRVLNAGEVSVGDAVALIFIAVACLVIALPEVMYVRDSFDGSSSYRMNTVFKFFYQAWVLLGIAGAYAVFRGWHVLRDYFSPVYGWMAVASVALGTVGGLYYTVNAPQSANQGGLATSLDGASSLQASAPGDYRAVEWLRSHVGGSPVELEGTGNEYDAKFARISTFTGLPTVMGWAGHEYQWRGADPEIAARVSDIKTTYTTTNVHTAEQLLSRYRVRYVIVGPTEMQTYPGSGLTKFSQFMRRAYSSSGTTVYEW